MKKAECDCGAMFRTENENELVQIVKLHSKRTHQMDVSDADARKGIKEA